MSQIKPGPMPPFPKPRVVAKKLKRWKQVNKVNPARVLQDRVYRIKRKAFLEDRPVCEVRVKPNGSMAHRRSKFPMCGQPSSEVHHIRKRGRYYLDTKYWLATGSAFTCNHHGQIEANKKQAVKLGYLERVYTEP